VIEELTITANGLTFRALAAGPPDAPVALLLHGFPEGAESWLPQLEALGAAGRRAVAPDQRGYGGSDAPEGVDAYLLPNLLDDVEGIIDSLGVEQVDLAGHDWGAIIGWPFTSQRQHRVRTWAALSVGHPHALRDVIQEGDDDQLKRSSYIQVFNQPGTAEDLLLEDRAARLRAIYQGAFPRGVEDGFVSDMQRPGRLTAALNYYRANLTPERFASFDAAPNPIDVPTLFIWGEEDPALGRKQAERTEKHVNGRYQFAPLAGAGHWLQHERPADVSRLLVRHAISE
jgi:pimeloyl-ACP methyl ester carboxylesterase